MENIFHGENCNNPDCKYKKEGNHCGFACTCTINEEKCAPSCSYFIPRADKKEDSTIFDNGMSSYEDYFNL